MPGRAESANPESIRRSTGPASSFETRPAAAPQDEAD